MRPKTSSLHPFLILLAVAMASVLFVVSCGGGGEATEVAQAPEAAEEAESAAAPEAAEEAESVELQLEEIPEVSEGLVLQAEIAEETAEEGAPKYGGTMVLAMPADHITLDPPLQISNNDYAVTDLAYDNLLMIQPDFTVKPELATSWEANEDLSSYTFHLREGVRFYPMGDYPGKDFKAEDVLFTFKRLMDPVIDSPARPTFTSTIKDIVAVDDYTVRFDLVGPNSFFLDTLSIYQARILPADVDEERLTLEAFGTGPFIIDEHLPLERTTFVPNPDYWEEGKPYLDQFVILNIPEPATRAQALQSGDVDVVYTLEPQDIPGVDAHPDTVVLKVNSLSWIGMPIRTDIPPFDNKLVRKAMQAALDREAVNQAALLGLGTPAFDHPVPPIDPRFAPQYAPPDYDPELAKQLLAEAGYPDGIDITLHTGDVGPGMVEMAVAYQQSAKAAGIRVALNRVSPDGYWDEVWGEEPFSVVYWFGRPNPDQSLSIQYLSDSSWNKPRYFNKTLDDLVIRARGETLEKQIETYAEIQRILIDDVPRLVVAFQPWVYGVRNNVRGVAPHPLGWPLFQDGWMDE